MTGEQRLLFFMEDPAAIFWMLGFCCWFNLAWRRGLRRVHSPQLLKCATKIGQLRGGPAFFISAKGLKAPWAGAVFSLALI